MSRQVGVVIAILFGLMALGLIVVWIARGRVDRDRLMCEKNLGDLSQFAVLNTKISHDPHAPVRGEFANIPTIPPGTVYNPRLTPEQRLSWVVHLLPTFDQKRQETTTLLSQIDRSLAWDASKHHDVSRARLVSLLCPGNPALTASPAVTQYVGLGGIGPDGASQSLVPMPFVAHAPLLASPRAGCFRYDSPTPFDAIADGLSQSVLFGELSGNLAPWLQGGPGTIRTLDVQKNANAPIGTGGQFGGNHILGTYFAFADGHVGFFTERTNPKVLEGLFTICGGGVDPMPGE